MIQFGIIVITEEIGLNYSINTANPNFTFPKTIKMSVDDFTLKVPSLKSALHFFNRLNFCDLQH